MDCNCNLLEFKLEDNTQTINVNLGDSPLPGSLSDYDNLRNKPKINNVILQGNTSLEELGIINDKNYHHVQSVASNEWIVHHNLNKYPSVTVIDSAENEVIGEVEHIDRNSLKIKFAGSFSGKATLN